MQVCLKLKQIVHIANKVTIVYQVSSCGSRKIVTISNLFPDIGEFC